MKKLEVVLSSVRVFHLDDLTFFPNKCGFSYYKGILVFWDEDYDKRILKMIDKIETYCGISNLLATGKKEGVLTLLWQDELLIPPNFKEGIEVENDGWSVCNLFVNLERWDEALR